MTLKTIKMYQNHKPINGTIKKSLHELIKDLKKTFRERTGNKMLQDEAIEYLMTKGEFVTKEFIKKMKQEIKQFNKPTKI